VVGTEIETEVGRSEILLGGTQKKESNSILLLSVRKPYSQLILLGKKRFELRKRPPKTDCRFALIYETHPTQAIVGYFEIGGIYIDSVDKIWGITRGKSYLSRGEFEEYYKNKKYGVAFMIKKSTKLINPLNLSELGINHAPQDFMYVGDKDLKGLIRI